VKVEQGGRGKKIENFPYKKVEGLELYTRKRKGQRPWKEVRPPSITE